MFKFEVLYFIPKTWLIKKQFKWMVEQGKLKKKSVNKSSTGQHCFIFPHNIKHMKYEPVPVVTTETWRQSGSGSN